MLDTAIADGIEITIHLVNAIPAGLLASRSKPLPSLKAARQSQGLPDLMTPTNSMTRIAQQPSNAILEGCKASWPDTYAICGQCPTVS